MVTDNNTNNINSPDDEIGCYNCGNVGHYKRNCPSLYRTTYGRFPQADQWQVYSSGQGAHDVFDSGNTRRNKYFRAKRSVRQRNKINTGQMQVCQWCQRPGHTA